MSRQLTNNYKIPFDDNYDVYICYQNINSLSAF